MTKVSNNHNLHPEILPEFLSEQPEPSWVVSWRQFYGMDFSAKTSVQKLGSVNLAGYKIAVQLLQPPQPRATLVVIHGYYDHMGLYSKLFTWALEQGFAVISCDLPGHGLSTGARASINSFVEYQRVFAGILQLAELLQLPAPWHVAGQSLGGAICFEHFLTSRLRAELGQLILFAPLVRPKSWRKAQLLYSCLRPFVRRIARRRSNNSTDLGFVDFLQQDPLQYQYLPTAWVGALKSWIKQIEQAPPVAFSPIIIQGDNDQTVDWQHNLRVLNAKFAAPKICMLAGAGHHLVNESLANRQLAFNFIEQHL